MKLSTVIRIISAIVIIGVWVGLYYYVFNIVRNEEIEKDGILITLKSYPQILAMELNFLFMALAIPVAAISYAIWEMPQDIFIRLLNEPRN